MMIDREKAIRILEKCAKEPLKRNADRYVVTLDVRFVNSILELLKEQEAVIRCKDCKHATMTSDGKMCKYCAMDTDDFGDQRNVYHDADWFCADGERKEGDGDAD